MRIKAIEKYKACTVTAYLSTLSKVNEFIKKGKVEGLRKLEGK